LEDVLGIELQKCLNQKPNLVDSGVSWHYCNPTPKLEILITTWYDGEYELREIFITKNSRLVYAKESIMSGYDEPRYTSLWNCEYLIDDGVITNYIVLGMGETARDDWRPESIFEQWHARSEGLDKLRPETIPEGITYMDSTEAELFWKTCVIPFIEKDSAAIEKVLHFPLVGDWGGMMKLGEVAENLSKKDFFNGYDKLFDEEYLAVLKKQLYTKIELNDFGDGEHQVIVGGGGYEGYVELEGKRSYSILLRYKKFKGQWKLFVIQGVG